MASPKQGYEYEDDSLDGDEVVVEEATPVPLARLAGAIQSTRERVERGVIVGVPMGIKSTLQGAEELGMAAASKVSGAVGSLDCTKADSDGRVGNTPSPDERKVGNVTTNTVPLHHLHSLLHE